MISKSLLTYGFLVLYFIGNGITITCLKIISSGLFVYNIFIFKIMNMIVSSVYSFEINITVIKESSLRSNIWLPLMFICMLYWRAINYSRIPKRSGTFPNYANYCLGKQLGEF